MTPKQFNQWLDTFIQEKGIDPEQSFEIEGESGTNYMTYENVIETLKQVDSGEQFLFYERVVRLDFYNQPIEPFLEHLAQAIAI
jgi:hypothetical protein